MSSTDVNPGIGLTPNPTVSDGVCTAGGGGRGVVSTRRSTEGREGGGAGCDGGDGGGEWWEGSAVGPFAAGWGGPSKGLTPP